MEVSLKTELEEKVIQLMDLINNEQLIKKEMLQNLKIVEEENQNIKMQKALLEEEKRKLCKINDQIKFSLQKEITNLEIIQDEIKERVHRLTEQNQSFDKSNQEIKSHCEVLAEEKERLSNEMKLISEKNIFLQKNMQYSQVKLQKEVANNKKKHSFIRKNQKVQFHRLNEQNELLQEKNKQILSIYEKEILKRK